MSPHSNTVKHRLHDFNNAMIFNVPIVELNLFLVIYQNISWSKNCRWKLQVQILTLSQKLGLTNSASTIHSDSSKSGNIFVCHNLCSHVECGSDTSDCVAGQQQGGDTFSVHLPSFAFDKYFTRYQQSMGLEWII